MPRTTPATGCTGTGDPGAGHGSTRSSLQVGCRATACGTGLRSSASTADVPIGDNRRVLPAGVTLRQLQPHADDRGIFTELFRGSWDVGVTPVQWNAVRSASNVFRGLHAHVRHWDYLTVPIGRALIGVHDLRDDSSTPHVEALVELAGDAPAGLTIPPGVAHGFYFLEPSLHVYAVSHEWDPDDELGCRWDDPQLGIEWPCDAPLLSPRDAALGPLSELRAAVNAAFARV
jgi:dTDP-4-dehydrorhamnose 3,5-epimerase